MHFWKSISRYHFAWQNIIILTIIFFSGGLIELLQGYLNRSPDMMDLARDLAGGLVSMAFFTTAIKTISKNSRRIFQLLAFVLLIILLYPLAIALTDELIAAKQFPLLSGFETPFEINRWHGNSAISVADTVSSHGKSSLKVKLNTSKYSGVTLRNFPGNWRNFASLNFSIYNPSERPIEIHCRIHDIHHRSNGQKYSDRFNKKFTIQSGWQTIKIDILDIINAPKGRKMDIENIQGIGLFAVQLAKPEIIYLDNILLVNRAQ